MSTKFQSLTDIELQNLWDVTVDFDERDEILKELQTRKLFPSKGIESWESDTGAYPDIIDPMFLQKLLAKREFAESLQQSWKPRTNPCDDTGGIFEVTPVQRFVANFMSPKTPYMSALLYHGVGVGKTCAAVQIIEAWLESFPRTEVYLVAPPTIQQGFFKTIFDINKVKIGQDNEPNTASQCTGDTYMKLTNTLYERDPTRIERAVNRAIKRRYKLFGYVSFANFIKDILKGIPKDASEDLKASLKKKEIRRYFSGKLLVVDEAHNLRDLSEDIADEQPDLPGGKAEKSDSAGGKLLTPFLRDVLQYSEGLKYVMLTATPMYNTYREIIFVLNLLLLNDKKATLIESDIFDKDGNITDKGKEILSYTAQRYVSFMRGENPISFPVRLFPQNTPKLESYPPKNPKGATIPESELSYFNNLPIVPITLTGDALQASIAFTNSLPPGGKGLSTIALEKLVHAGNFIVPATPENNGNDFESYKRRTDITGLSTIFNRESVGGEVRFRAINEGGARWLGEDQISQYSPKFAFLLEKLKSCDGVVFAYTRFVNAGALPLALALEANGYSPYGRKSGLLANGPQTPGGRQCALCSSREKFHTSNTHTFTPAYYGLLTGDISISPKNEQTIQGEKSFDNADGSKMKIIIGSQIASEGVDLRFVRETHVIDSWFHLNKTEQILGRAIRYLSHCALPPEKRNNTVYLYAAVFPSGKRETADLYSYRTGFKKAVQVGNVSRIMKQAAIDCNLNNNAIIIKGQEPIQQIDSQRNVREDVDINDMPFTAVCDWIETCDYKCSPSINIVELELDNSTYDQFSAKWRISKMKERIRKLFEEQSFYRYEDLWDMLSDIPRIVAVDLLSEIVDNQSFQVTHNGVSGYIRYCNKYYLFQPSIYNDLSIPLAIRVSKFPIKRDSFTPIAYEIPELVVDEEDRINTTENLEGIWAVAMEWCESLSTSTKFINPPNELYQRIDEMSQNNRDLVEKYIQVLDMIKVFFNSFNKSTNKNTENFRKTILYYLWDNWLTIDEQKYLIYSTSLNITECIRDGQYQLGRFLINRFVDPKDGLIVYLCENGTICARSLIDAVNRDNKEALKTFKVTPTSTASIYGFIVPKTGSFVFKTGEPPAEGKAVGRGKECGNVTTMKGHISNLELLGTIMKNSNKTDFGMNKRDGILSGDTIKNATRACTIIELMLRFMDLEQINNKRWFYRPIQAYYTGHKGLFRAKV